MCADRGNDTISNLYQVYYPAVLRSLKNIIESGVKAVSWSACAARPLPIRCLSRC